MKLPLQCITCHPVAVSPQQQPSAELAPAPSRLVFLLAAEVLCCMFSAITTPPAIPL
jgi:hypothetical protein